MGQIPNKTYTAPDGSVYRIEADGSVAKIKGGRVQSNEPPSKYQISPDGKIFRVEADGSLTYIGKAEDPERNGHRLKMMKGLWGWIVGLIVVLTVMFVFIERGTGPMPAVVDNSEIQNNYNYETIRGILSSNYTVQYGYQLHFYEGQTYETDGTCRNIMIAFCVADGELKKAIYKNMELGGKIAMDISYDNSILLSGLEGNKNFTIELSPAENDRLVGQMIVGTKRLNVRIMPSLDTFKISHIR